MDEKLLKILDSIEQLPEDENDFGRNIIKIIKKSEALHDPKNDYAYLKQFLNDEINFLEQEIPHTAKYAGIVYHSNVSRSREFEKEICKKILEELNRI
ncbi:MAG: hypothetical protein PHU42_04415 [Patescibacteria group bacterium]|nr:hypothetical protein [Patescibacteria group bacterium]